MIDDQFGPTVQKRLFCSAVTTLLVPRLFSSSSTIFVLAAMTHFDMEIAAAPLLPGRQSAGRNSNHQKLPRVVVELLSWFNNVFSVPPSWLEKPSNQEVTLGQKVELACRADGAPTPKITWKKEIGKGIPFCTQNK